MGGHTARETKALEEFEGEAGRGAQERVCSGKGPRGRQKAEQGRQWEGAGQEGGGTSRGGGASGLRADGGDLVC